MMMLRHRIASTFAREETHDASGPSETVLPYATGEKLVEPDEETERRFQDMREVIPVLRESCVAAYKYWEENGMLGVNSFAELLEKRRSG